MPENHCKVMVFIRELHPCSYSPCLRVACLFSCQSQNSIKLAAHSVRLALLRMHVSSLGHSQDPLHLKIIAFHVNRCLTPLFEYTRLPHFPLSYSSLCWEVNWSIAFLLRAPDLVNKFGYTTFNLLHCSVSQNLPQKPEIWALHVCQCHPIWCLAPVKESLAAPPHWR